jgi:toxin ParE1/3/4
MPDVRLTDAAAGDVEEIERYSASEFGPALTVEYLQGLADALRRLSHHPGIGIGRDDLRSGTRSLRYRSHRIYYRPVKDGVVVQRVLHQARQVRRDMMP